MSGENVRPIMRPVVGESVEVVRVWVDDGPLCGLDAGGSRFYGYVDGDAGRVVEFDASERLGDRIVDAVLLRGECWVSVEASRLLPNSQTVEGVGGAA